MASRNFANAPNNSYSPNQQEHILVSSRSGLCSLWGTNWSSICNMIVVPIATVHVGTAAIVRVLECQTDECIDKVSLRLVSWVSRIKSSHDTRTARPAAVRLSCRHYDINIESSAPNSALWKLSEVAYDGRSPPNAEFNPSAQLPLWPLKQIISHNLTFNIRSSALLSVCL